jgi:ubiquinone/menaquinone biosynthesis C-methylase UbiE
MKQVSTDAEPSDTKPGGYDDGYAACPCFWGREPGSLVRTFLSQRSVNSLRVLDLGCGEGKNALAFANAGASVVAVDCSELALKNGKAAFGTDNIEWHHDDCVSYLDECNGFDVIVMYGLLHCLRSVDEIAGVIAGAVRATKMGGYHLLVAFNDGAHDLSAHPSFKPTLVSHGFYIRQYDAHTITSAENAVIHETHPNNGIAHFHSLTRLVARMVL